MQLSPFFRKAWPFIWKKWNHLHPRMLCVKFGWKLPSGSGDDFLKFSMYFYYFPIVSPLWRLWPFIGTNLKPLLPRMLCSNFGWSWTSGSGEEDFFKVFNVFVLFHNYLLFRKGVANHLNKLESPSQKDVLCQVWLKLNQWFWRGRFKKVVNFILSFPKYLPFGMSETILWINLNPLHLGILCARKMTYFSSVS